MTIYFIFILCIFMLLVYDSMFWGSINNESKYKQTGKAYFLAILLVFSFSAFRFDIGWDFKAYYDTIQYNIVTNIISNDEHLTIALIRISQQFKKPELYFIINSFIQMFLIFKTIDKYSEDKWISLIWFVFFPLFYLNSMSVIRMFTALSIIFYSFTFIEQGKKVKYLISVFIASLFHKSAIIAIFLYLFKYISLNRTMIIVLSFFSPLINNIFNNLILKYIPHYGVYTRTTETSAGRYSLLLFIVIGIWGLVYKEKIVSGKNKSTVSLYYNLYYYGLIVYLMFFKQGTMGHRFSLYGTIYSLLLLPRIINIFTKKEQVYIRMLVAVIAVLSFIYTLYVGSRTYIPYKTIWSNP